MGSFSGKHVLVLGLGLHGGAVGNITWLASQGARITVSDTKSREQLETSIQKLSNIPGIEYLFGSQDEISLDGVDMILRNPAVPRKAVILQKAREKNIPVVMDSNIFFDQVGRKRIIGITGSKGKTTTSHAIYHILKSIISETIAVGVDGVSPLGTLTLLSSAPIVFELSSWRLEALQEVHASPHIAICTSIYQDHLNTYNSYEDYIQAKKQIIADQTENDIAILNYDDEIIRTWEQDVRGELYWYSLKPLPSNLRGIWIDNDSVCGNVISAKAGIQESTTWMPDQVGHNNTSKTSAKICKVSDIPHTSPHELRNKLPAILLAVLFGASPETIQQTVRSIPQLQHRMQLVRELNGVQYINDTTATMPDATIAALTTMQEKPLILILGGSDKALEFTSLAHAISEHKNLKHLIWLPGTATLRMQQAIRSHTSAQMHDIATMQEAVILAQKLAQAGDAVILSPGATSFGLFLHEFDRGDAFISTVEQLR